MNELAPTPRTPRALNVHQGRRYAARLRDLDAQKLTTPGDYPDGDRLFLHIGANGTKSWVFKYQFQGARHEMGLGPYPLISLAEARGKAADARKLLARGIESRH